MQKRSALCLGLGLLLTIIACKDAGLVAPFPGGMPGPILFISSASGGHQLYSMNPDGSNIRQVTFDQNFEIINARWSPDGSMIVIESPVGGYGHYGPALYVMTADGSQKWRLTNPTPSSPNYGTGGYATWSPDSRRIGFSRLMMPESRGNYDIFIINADGSGERQVTSTLDTSEFVGDWSKDGQIILGDEFDWVTKDSLGRRIPNSRITWFNLQGQILHTQGQAGYNYLHPRYSQKGDRIVYMSTKNFSQNIFVSNTDGTGEVQISEPFYSSYLPVGWSPDDSLVLYIGGPTNYMSGNYGKTLLGDILSHATRDITPWNDSIYSYAVSWRRR